MCDKKINFVSVYLLYKEFKAFLNDLINVGEKFSKNHRNEQKKKTDGAIILVERKSSGITRKSWMSEPITIILTSTPDCCLIISSN